MRSFLEAQGIEQWKIVENGYKVTKTPLTDVDDLTKYNTNSKAKNHIINALKNIFLSKLCIVRLQRKYGTRSKLPMKGIRRSKQSNSKPT